MSDKFEIAVKIVKELPKDGPINPTIEDKLEFYEWCKTATVGAVDTVLPGMFNFQEKAKWDTWQAAQTTPTAECKRRYAEKLISILESNEEARKYLTELE